MSSTRFCLVSCLGEGIFSKKKESKSTYHDYDDQEIVLDRTAIIREISLVCVFSQKHIRTTKITFFMQKRKNKFLN